MRMIPALKITRLLTPAIAAVVLAVATAAASAQAPAAPPAHRPMPAPTNLKVLPKDLTGDQVMEIMHKWEAMLGAECNTCHAADPAHLMPNGRPRLNFADDSKKEKQIARMMYKMTEQINVDYISKVENSGQPVSCGTCHRGHVTPEQFVPKPEHDHDHDHPAGAPGHDHDDHDHPGN
ncbi:c-type cytochrome [Acidobacteria bacterium AB60]|nr:c-type cytochrome [Acidobacteria bacterium AB60]